eukprot:scaffold11205_cov221-Skeletonema_dohrnii-CCMP3373.AAC.1
MEQGRGFGGRSPGGRGGPGRGSAPGGRGGGRGGFGGGRGRGGGGGNVILRYLRGRRNAGTGNSQDSMVPPPIDESPKKP